MSQQSNYIAQAQQQCPVSLEHLLDFAATASLRPTKLLGTEGMSPKPERSTPEMSSAPFTTQTSICLGEPILSAIGLLSEPLVVVTGLAALGLVVFYLLG